MWRAPGCEVEVVVVVPVGCCHHYLLHFGGVARGVFEFVIGNLVGVSFHGTEG
jgi:hypothetical protein